jgi:hypothetical protein
VTAGPIKMEKQWEVLEFVFLSEYYQRMKYRRIRWTRHEKLMR